MSNRNQSKINPAGSVVLAAAVTATLAGFASAETAVITGQDFKISTSGATALGSFTSMQGDRINPTASTIQRGTMAVGTNMTIGNTAYTVPTSGLKTIGIADLGDRKSYEPLGSDDQVSYYYRESGSVQGILDLVDSNGLLITNGLQPRRPGDPAANTFLFYNGSRFNSVSSGYSSGTTPNVIAGTPSTGRTNGRNYQPNGSAELTQNGQPNVRIAWSDVRFEQAFSVDGTASANSTPTQAGYGRGAGTIGGNDFQRLRNSNVIDGGIAPATTKLRNETLAVVPFNLVANPGTGLTTVTKTEGKWLQATGRLQNGADFNSVTREIGSGTRNQGTLNLGLDPSFGGGERDRRYTGATNLSGAAVLDMDGNPTVITPGGELAPNLGLDGSTTQSVNENRISSIARFSDKISGSSGVRQTVGNSRMGLGILSAGDSKSSSSGTALDSAKSTTAVPLRALFIDWEDGNVTQAKVANVLDGTYRMWSASQAITVAPYANPTANDALAGNEYRPIAGDTNDQNVGGATSNSQQGIHRKFLDNITKSVATLSGSSSAITPADFMITNSYIPQQIMGVTKTYDGGAQTARTRSQLDPDGNDGPQVSEEQLYQNTVGSGKILTTETNWANPEEMNGGIATQAVKYRLWATSNTSSTLANANRTIDVSTRTNLAGDFNGDSVRDYNDTKAAALAYANASTYLDTPASGNANNWNYNGTAVKVTVNGGAGVYSSTGTNAAASDGLIVLSDFNSDGNVAVDSNSASFATDAIEREDVGFFLWGATVDTGAQSADPNVNKTKRETLVRTGNLRKNSAIDTFNGELDSFVGVVDKPGAPAGTKYVQNEINQLKFEKRDVDGSGSRAFTGVTTGNDHNFLVDAFLVDKFDNKSYRNFDHQVAAFAPQPVKLANGTTVMVDGPFNLVRAELNDSADGLINQADMDVMNQALTTTAGVNDTGRVDHTWQAATTKTGAGHIKLKPNAGTFVVPTGATLTVNNGTFEVGGTVDPLTDATDSTKKMAVTNNASFKVSGGNKNVQSLAGTGALDVTGGALQIAAKPTIHTVNNQGSLTLGAGGKLDVTNNKLVLASADPAAIRSAIIAGRNSGAWNGTSGISSSTAQNFGTADRRGVGYTSTTNSGLQQVTVSYAALGDTNLDKRVNLTDYNGLKSNYSSSPTATGKVWMQGDSNYDGRVNLTDYNLLKANYSASPAGYNTSDDAGLLTLVAAAADTLVTPAADPAELILEVNPATGLVRLKGDSGTVNTDGFTMYVRDTFDAVWKPGSLDLSGLPGLSIDTTSDATFIGAIGGATGYAPVTTAGVAIGSIFDTVAGAGLTAGDIYWEYSTSAGVTEGDVTFVPEPATLGVLALAGTVMLGRRRRAA